MASARIEVEKFDGRGDYTLWKEKLIAHLEILGLTEALEETHISEEKTSDPGEESDGKEKGGTFQEKMKEARSTIILSVSDQVLRKIIKEKTAASMFKALDKLYMSKALPNRIYLKQKLYSFKMTETQSIEGNIDDFLRLIADLENTNVTISDEDQAILLLMSLPRQFDQLRDTLRYGTARTTLVLEDVISVIHSKELELGLNRGKGLKTQPEGLYVKDKTENRGRPEQREKGKGNRSRSKSKSKRGCWICGEEGHFKSSCPIKNKSHTRPKDQGSNKAESSSAKGNLVETTGLCVTEAHHSTEVKLENEWIMDTGCSCHMTYRRDWFENLDEETEGTVRMGNKTVSKVKGTGSIRLKNEDGLSVVLTNVKYIPDMDRNLLSLGTFEKAGYKFESENGVLSIKAGGQTILQGRRYETLYLLKAKVVISESNAAEQRADDTVLWHRRLGHMSQKNMNVLVNKGLLDKKKVSTLELCEDCVYGRAKRVGFNIAHHNTKERLEYVHSDLWGAPSVPLSLSKCQYFISFIDDYTRKVWVYFLKFKDEAFEKFVEWVSLVENQTGLKLKTLRTDNRLEYCNKQFDGYCESKGIQRHRTCAYTPQQNGVAERMNRTIMEKVRSMLSDSGLPKRFWAEATHTSVMLINKTPSAALQFEIPDKKWFGRPPVYSYLRRFGCIVFVHTDDGKLSPRAKKGVLIGYPIGVKGYKVWLTEEKKLAVSRNVIFQENAVFKDLLKGNEGLATSEEDLSRSYVELDLDTESSSTSGGENDSSHHSPRSTTPNLQSPTHVNDDAGNDVSQSPRSYHLARDRERREVRPPVRFDDEDYYCEALYTTEDGNTLEPEDYREAKKDVNWLKWKVAMDEEIDSQIKNNTWTSVERPENQRVIGCRWIYKYKLGIPGVEEPRYKARLVAKGYAQREGVDYHEIFAPVVKHVSIRILLSIVAQEGLELEQLDVKTAFLHGELKEKIYMTPPEGYESMIKKNQVCLLNKALYGLKQAPRQWNEKFDIYMSEIGFVRSEYDNCAYTKKLGDDSLMYLLIYVDDMLVASNNREAIANLKKELSLKFEMKDLGPAKKILGIEISRNRDTGTLMLSQEGYLNKVLETYNMQDAKYAMTPLGAHMKLRAATEEQQANNEDFMKSIPYCNAVGSIMYAMIGTRPDLAYPVGVISRFMSNPIKEHWLAVKWVLRYIKGTLDIKLCYQKNPDFQITGYCDADHGADLDKRRSITGLVFTLGGNTISWKSGLQRVVALSSTESEYMSLTEAVKEAIWLKGLLREFGYDQKAVEIYCDSQSAIEVSKNNVHHDRTKHIDVKYHFIREVIASGVVEVLKISTEKNPADIFTKIVTVSKFQDALNLLQVRVLQRKGKGDFAISGLGFGIMSDWVGDTSDYTPWKELVYQSDPDDPDFEPPESESDVVDSGIESGNEGDGEDASAGGDDSDSETEKDGGDNDRECDNNDRDCENDGDGGRDEIRRKRKRQEGEGEEGQREKKPRRKENKDLREEDIMERFEFKMEEAVVNWSDAFQIRRGVIPESDNEDEDLVVTRDRKIRLVYHDKLAEIRNLVPNVDEDEP
ncbi:Reverse transcriptase RNA-dependent DNA polymerase [Arabidopsis thaliana x Arabidopsis arenosa]|uniref:Reverse transcriptase RNA-dependent DNA polymerase n=1 Tax=Arabidopsis thaliana x Arabidopsis arenosa TaxID=1240361 RepID=A0A8T1XE56_9BRAS|nr:Reverse transcriptase RNA-dependent DNA polymerase [Arabidopsis thaliana x Arabidopsis arenosa]